MAEPRPYTDRDVETAAAALLRRSSVPAGSGYHAPTPAETDAWLADRARVVLDALTADGWHPEGNCIRLTAAHWAAMREEAAEAPGSVEESKARLAETLRSIGWEPVAETRADVAEEIALHPGQDPSPASPVWWAGYKEALRDAAAIARQHSTPTEEPTP